MDKLFEFVSKLGSFKIWRAAAAYFSANKILPKEEFNSAFEGAFEKVLVLSILLFAANLSYWAEPAPGMADGLPPVDFKFVASIALVIVTGFSVYLLTNFTLRVITQSDLDTRFLINFSVFFLALLLSLALILNLIGASRQFSATVYTSVSSFFGCFGFSSGWISRFATVWLWYLTCSVPILILGWANGQSLAGNRKALEQGSAKRRTNSRKSAVDIKSPGKRSVFRLVSTAAAMSLLATAYCAKPFHLP